MITNRRFALTPEEIGSRVNVHKYTYFAVVWLAGLSQQIKLEYSTADRKRHVYCRLNGKTEPYTSADITRVTGIKRERLKRWHDFDKVPPPSIKEACGRGTIARYDIGDLLVFQAIADLTNAGISLRIAVEIALKII